MSAKKTAKATATKAKKAPKAEAPPAEQTSPSQAAATNLEGKPKKLSALSGAARVLQETGVPMTCQEMITMMAQMSLWTSPGGKTPQSTLYSAILREIAVKGSASRFCKTERGKFALNRAN